MKQAILFTSLLVCFSTYGQSLRELNDSLTYYFKEGQFNKAIVLGEKATIVAKKMFGENHSDYATSLTNLAVLYQSNGQYKKAEPLYMQAISILKFFFGENHKDYATALNNLAMLYEAMGQYERAEPLYIQSKDIRKKILGEYHPAYATSLNNLAELYESMGEYEKAELLLIQSKELLKKALGENYSDYARALGNLAALYTEISQYKKAEVFFIQAIEIDKKSFGENHPAYATDLNNLAFLYSSMGEYEKAEPLYIQSAAIDKEILGESHPNYATDINNLAGLYKDLGQNEKAEILYKKTIEIRKKIFGENQPDYAEGLNNLATLYESTGQYENAEVFYKKAIEIKKNILGENHPGYAIGLNNLAGLYQSIGQYEKAEPLLIQAKEIFRSVLGENHPNYAYSLSYLAGLYSHMGQYEKAEPLLIQSKEIFRHVLGENHPNYANSLNNLAGLYESMGQNKKAELLMVLNNRIIFENLKKSFTILSEKEKGNYLEKKISILETSNSFVYNHRKASPLIFTNNFNQQLLFKSLALADTKNVLASILQNPDTAVQVLFKDWQNSRSLLAKQYSLPMANRREDLKEIETQAENLEKKISLKSSVFRNQQNSIHISLQDVQKKLKQDEVAIEFVSFHLYNKGWTDSTIYAAYVLRKNDSIPVFVPLCEERQLQVLIDSAKKISTEMANVFYRSITPDDEAAATAGLGKELYKLIWQPIEPYLKGVKKICYSPAGKLYGIAFNALLADSATVLMDKYQMQQYTSTRQVVLREGEKQNRKPAGIVLFGNANFSMDSLQLIRQKKENSISTVAHTTKNRGIRGDGWSNLPGTAEEINKINKLFAQNKITTKSFTGTNASEENLKALNDKSPQVLHIATHGFFLPEPDKQKKKRDLEQPNSYTLADDPLLRSGLILAGGNYAWNNTPIDGVEDGIVTAYEISQLNLSNTELVVLSACETALGDVKGSEGVFGLQRAFKMAGVKKMIVSLWQVPDKETAELMTTFYNYWMKGKAINDAFAQAQADMRKKYPPFYWAAFVLIE